MPAPPATSGYAPPGSPPSWTPAPAYPMPRRNWKPIGGAVKMTGAILDGIGIILAGASIGFIVNTTTSAFVGPSPVLSFLNTLEAGIIVAGVGVIVFGIGLFIESL